MENKIGIYQIINVLNNDRYIGSSKNITKRFYEHKRTLDLNKHHSTILQRAWNKYGKDKFRFEYIVECNVQDLILLEDHYLKLYKPKYNIFKNATSSRLGIPHTKETKLKISQANKGKKLSQEHKIKFTRKGIKVSTYTKKLISDKNTGKKRTEEVKQKLSQIRKKEAESPFVLKRLKEIGAKGRENRVYKTGWTVSEETREKMILSRYKIAVVSFDLNYKELDTFSSVKEAALHYGIDANGIRRKLDKDKTYKNMIWKKK